MRFEDRYARAMRSTNLKSEASTTHSGADIVGAAGLAAKKQGLAIALLRLSSGDNHAAIDIVELMTKKLVGKAYRMQPPITHNAASMLARIVLDWFLDSKCKACGGHGYVRISGTPTLSDKECAACHGRGRRPFETLFSDDRVDLARWMLAELEREMGLAGPAALAALGPR